MTDKLHNWKKQPDNEWDIPEFKCSKCGATIAGERPMLPRDGCVK